MLASLVIVANETFITFFITGENTRKTYFCAMRRFFRFWVRKRPDWDPSSLLHMNGEGPIPKIPPLEPFAMDNITPAS